jgi:formylmethanofuran dehydrogenase subunit B
MSDPGFRAAHTNVPSPFCGLASDDLRIEADGDRVRVVANGDPVTVAGFELPVADKTPRVAGRAVGLDGACERAAELITNSACPVFSGFGTDVADTRAALALIDRCRGIFDQERAEAGVRNLLVLSDSGWIATTLGEVKNRVDVLLVFGTDIESAFPRFFDRFIWTGETLFGGDPGLREIIYIGQAPSGRAAYAPDGRAPMVLPCEPDFLPEVAAVLCALLRGAPLQATEVGGLSVDDLRRVADRLREARYSVVTWAAGKLDFPHAELTIQALCAAVVELNKTTRSSVLPLGGQDGDRTASQVCAWQTGYPTRVSFARGYPHYDPYLNSAARLLQSGEADLLCWISSIGMRPPPRADVPTIVIARSGVSLEQEPEVFIPVGVPGIDHAGLSYRCDSVVAMPLYKLRESGLPTACAVLQRIEGLLAAADSPGGR